MKEKYVAAMAMIPVVLLFVGTMAWSRHEAHEPGCTVPVSRVQVVRP